MNRSLFSQKRLKHPAKITFISVIQAYHAENLQEMLGAMNHPFTYWNEGDYLKILPLDT